MKTGLVCLLAVVVVGWLSVFRSVPTVAHAASAGQIIISEFRFRGPSGTNDEFIEVYNTLAAPHTVSAISGTGYAVAASNGVARCVIPNGTIIPAHGHYLCVNSVGYSLAAYPAGNGTTATGDASYTIDIPDNAGIAIFNTSVAASFNLANRLDAVGSTTEANPVYKEGTGYSALAPGADEEHAFVRDTCGKGGVIATFGLCPTQGLPKDTNNNVVDFYFVDTDGESLGFGQRLGAPGPQNLSSPTQVNAFTPISLLDHCVASWTPPNRFRDFTPDPANNSAQGTLDIRRTITNNTGVNITRLRFRIIDLTTFPTPPGTADLRPRTSPAVVDTVDRAPCGAGTSNVTVQGTTLEQPPGQANGGGFNSSMSLGTVTLATPMANGATIDFRILLGIQLTGNYKLGLAVETLPYGGFTTIIQGGTEGADSSRRNVVTDFNADGRADPGIFRRTTVPDALWYSTPSGGGQNFQIFFGADGDIPVPGDYNGDGKTDAAIFRNNTPSGALWYGPVNGFPGIAIQEYLGIAGDIPVPCDLDADGITDPVIFRPSDGRFLGRKSAGGTLNVIFGNSADIPFAGDFDGDFKCDVGVMRAGVGPGGTNLWYAPLSAVGTFQIYFGAVGDIAVPGDYDGDGKTDAAIWRPSTGLWYGPKTGAASIVLQTVMGANGDILVHGDYDGDYITDIAFYRPSTGQFFGASVNGPVVVNTNLGDVAGDMPTGQRPHYQGAYPYSGTPRGLATPATAAPAGRASTTPSTGLASRSTPVPVNNRPLPSATLTPAVAVTTTRGR